MDDRQGLLRQIKRHGLAVHRSGVRVHVVAWLALLLATFTAMACAFSFVGLGERQQEIADQAVRNCARLHQVVSSGVMVIDARRRLRAFLRSHAITQAQYDAGVQETVRNLRIWRTADCDPVKEAKTAGQ